MSQPAEQGLDRQGLDQSFAVDEKHKSNLLLEAQLLRAQGHDEQAASRLAEAAALEESLSERCLEAGLKQKAWVHRFSAASCWAQAGNFFQAIAWCDDLLGQEDIPDSLRGRVQDYRQQLRQRRSQWYADLALATAARDQ
jgi:hypothetical protein